MPRDPQLSKSKTSSTRSSLATSNPRLSGTLSDSSSDDASIGSRHKKKDRLANAAETQWPVRIRLFYDDGIKVRLQGSVIKTIITEAIRCCEREMITSNAFPETKQRDGFCYRMTKQAIRLLRAEMKDNQDYEDAYYCAKKDTTFVHRIGELVGISATPSPPY